MQNKDQDQQAVGGSLAIQAAGNVTVTTSGLSYADVRNVALDVFNSNFFRLADPARETAQIRAEAITDKFLSKLKEEAPASIEKSQDPDFQYALLTVQREYAKSGDKELGDLLVDLLVDRSKQQNREILQIVLNEAINTAPKLTDSQLAALSVVFLFNYTQDFSVRDHKSFGEFLDRFVAPLIPNIVKNNSCYQHLEFCGCGSVGPFVNFLQSRIGSVYQGLFTRGFDQKRIEESAFSTPIDSGAFIQCLNDESKIQVSAMNEDQLAKFLMEFSIPLEDQAKIKTLFDEAKLNADEIREKCIQIRPYMAELFEAWSESMIKSLTLTSVGIAIGHANLKRHHGEFTNLSVWIN